MPTINVGINSRLAATRVRAPRQGTILGLARLVMSALSILVLGFWQLRMADGVEAGRDIASVESFWVAEAGLHDALARLHYSTGYQTSPPNVTGATTNGAVAVNGLGTLVATGPIVLQNGAVVSNHIVLIAGAVLSSYGNVIVKNGDTPSANTGVSLNNNAITMSHGNVLTPGDINTYQNFTISGIMYAGGNWGMNNNGVINGSEISGHNILISPASRMTLRNSQPRLLV